MLNRTTFFTYVRRAPFGGRLLQAQIDTMEAILAAWEASRFSNLDWLAYILATAFHETGAAMAPIKEKGGASYFIRLYDVRGKDPARARRMGNTEPGDGPLYCGRGFVQLTWKTNYRKASAVVGADLVKNPDLAMRPDFAARIMLSGMTEGWFTGRKLSDYFSASRSDPVGARAIVNGKDKAQLIAGYFTAFKGAVEAADAATPQPVDVSPELARADDVAPHRSRSLLTLILGYLTGGGGLSLFAAVNNPWAALVFGVVFLAVGGGAVWLIASGRLVELKRLGF